MATIKRNNVSTVIAVFGLVWFLINIAACEQGPTVDPGTSGYPETGCVGCHTDKDTLKEIADPIETVESSGEG